LLEIWANKKIIVIAEIFKSLSMFVRYYRKLLYVSTTIIENKIDITIDPAWFLPARLDKAQSIERSSMPEDHQDSIEDPCKYCSRRSWMSHRDFIESTAIL
jgi:hypothetical protein